MNPRQTLAQNLITIEYFHYRSSVNLFVPGTPFLVFSQGHSIWLVQQAMKHNALIVVRFGRERWFDAVKGLGAYQGLLLLKGNRQVHLSPSGFVDPDGFKKVLEKLVSAGPPNAGKATRVDMGA